MKTMMDWEKSNINYFEDFCFPGDLVGKDVIEHFRNVLPPITDKANLMQVGEPYSSVEGKSTYPTFVNKTEGWIYKGNCFKGEAKSPFEQWLDKFIDEKGIDISEEFKSTNNGISMIFTYNDVLINLKRTSETEQEDIKKNIIALDFYNSDIKDYLKHLSKALIPEPNEVQRYEDIYGESIGIEKNNEEEEL